MAALGQFLNEVFRDYAKRFWIFWTVLYIAIVLVELSRQVFLEMLSPFAVFNLSFPELVNTVLANEILGNPYILVPLLAMFFFNVWGFGALFFAFSGASAQESIRLGFKNLHRYAGFVLVAGLLTALGFILLPAAAAWLIDIFYGEALRWLAVPLALVFGIPGIYLLVAFSNAPLILLLEEKSIWGSLKESARRVTPRWFMAAIYLLVSLIIAGVAYYLLSWLTFSLKLALIPDLSLRGESMLRVFLYSIPWVIVASFYDLALYHLYRRFATALPARYEEELVKTAGGENSPRNNINYFSPNIMKAISTLVLVAFIFSFVLVPIPVQAGGLFGTALGSILGYAASFLCGPAAPACAVVVAIATSMAFQVVGSQILGTETTIDVIGLNPFKDRCHGTSDPIFGTCTRREHREGQQEIRVSKNIKFTKVTFPDIPTPSEFSANPDSVAPVTFEWRADAQPGLVNYFSVIDSVTNRTFRGNCTGTVGNVCSAGPVTTVCELPYEKDLQAQIWLASCWQTARRGTRPTCAGCGGDVVGVKYNFTTPSLPLPRADIKADGKDGSVVFKPGVPIILNWTTEYALEAEANGSWSGSLPLSGSQTVTPQTGNEVYTLIARRGDKSGSDSVSSAPATPQIQIFDSKGGGSGGGVGSLRIEEFNITDPLNPGDTVTISWSVSGAESCEVDNGIGEIPTVGSADVTFLRTTSFILTCTDDDGNTVSATRTVEVKKVPGVREIKPE